MVLLIPAVIPSTLVFVLWKWMYNYQVGPINHLLVDVFGQAGRHARAAVAAPVLPLGSPVEVELIVEVGSPSRRDVTVA